MMLLCTDKRNSSIGIGGNFFEKYSKSLQLFSHPNQNKPALGNWRHSFLFANQWHWQLRTQGDVLLFPSFVLLMPMVPPYPDAIDFVPEIANDLTIIQLFKPSNTASTIRPSRGGMTSVSMTELCFPKVPALTQTIQLSPLASLPSWPHLLKKYPKSRTQFNRCSHFKKG
jgi:hypothetical protein